MEPKPENMAMTAKAAQHHTVATFITAEHVNHHHALLRAFYADPTITP
jgi:hypothetical protein